MGQDFGLQRMHLSGQMSLTTLISSGSLLQSDSETSKEDDAMCTEQNMVKIPDHSPAWSGMPCRSTKAPLLKAACIGGMPSHVHDICESCLSLSHLLASHPDDNP